TERPCVWVSTLMKLYPAIWLKAKAPPHTGNCATPLVTSSGLVTAPQNQLRDGGLWISPCASTPVVSPHSVSPMTTAGNGLMMVIAFLSSVRDYPLSNRSLREAVVSPGRPRARHRRRRRRGRGAGPAGSPWPSTDQAAR